MGDIERQVARGRERERERERQSQREKQRFLEKEGLPTSIHHRVPAVTGSWIGVPLA